MKLKDIRPHAKKFKDYMFSKNAETFIKNCKSEGFELLTYHIQENGGTLTYCKVHTENSTRFKTFNISKDSFDDRIVTDKIYITQKEFNSIEKEIGLTVEQSIKLNKLLYPFKRYESSYLKFID